MSSWTFETFQTQHPTHPQWHIGAEYRWNKGNTYETYVGVFDNQGMEIRKIFSNTYGNIKSAKMAFQRQVRLIKKGVVS